MLHVIVKDYENSGFVWDGFYCQACFEKNIVVAETHSDTKTFIQNLPTTCK